MGSLKDHYFGDRPYPAAPGWKEPTTSRDAARKMAARAPTMCDQVVAVLRESYPFGKTADEVATAMGRSIMAIRPRFSELRERGVIRATEERRTNESGLSATVWVLMRKGPM